MPGTEWHWGCLECGDGGQADSAAHATSLERMHRVFACWLAPGLDPDEKARRKAWRDVKRERYELGRHPESAIKSGALRGPGEDRGGAIAPVAPYQGPHAPPPVPPAVPVIVAEAVPDAPAPPPRVVDVELPADDVPDDDLFPGE